MTATFFFILISMAQARPLTEWQGREPPVDRGCCGFGTGIKFDPGTILETEFKIGNVLIRSHREPGTAVLESPGFGEVLRVSWQENGPMPRAQIQFFAKPWMVFKVNDTFINYSVTDLKHIIPHRYSDSALSLYTELAASTGNTTGFIYTLKGGFIDVPHLRDHLDWTGYLYNQFKAAAEKNLFKYQFDMNLSAHATIEVEFDDSTDLIALAQRVSFDLGVWHETLTWYIGHLANPLISEVSSAFSPEDLYSDLLGAVIARKVLRDPEREFDAAADFQMKRTLSALEAVEEKKTLKYLKSLDGRWWDSTKHLCLDDILLKRNVDFSANRLTPWLVHSNQEPHYLELPFANSKNAKVTFRVKDHQGKLPFLPPEGGQFLDTDFIHIMKDVEKDIMKKFGPESTSP